MYSNGFKKKVNQFAILLEKLKANLPFHQGSFKKYFRHSPS